MTASFSVPGQLYQIIAGMALHLVTGVLFNVDEHISHRRPTAPLCGHSSGPGGRHVLSNPVDRPAGVDDFRLRALLREWQLLPLRLLHQQGNRMNACRFE